MTRIIFKNKFWNGVLNVTCLFFFVVFIFAISGKVGSAEVIDRIVAVVNDDVIALTELNREMKQGIDKIEAQGFPEDEKKEHLSNYRTFVLDQLINQKLIDQEIKRLGVSVSDEEVDKTIQEFREKRLLTEEQLKKDVEKTLGISMEEYKEKIKEQILRMRLINSQVQSKIVVTDEDRKAYYEEHGEQFTEGVRYHLKNIIMRVPPEASESKKQEILAKMKGILEELKKGKPFEEMADKYSESSGSGEGGDLGFFRFDDLSQELQESLKDVKEGEFTPIIDTEFGYQIIYVEKIEKDSGKSFEEASPDIDKQIYNDSAHMKFQSWLIELRKQSYIKIIE